MAPEYALWGHLSDKADVYSFGVVALEIVSGKNNNKYIPNNDSVCLLEWVLFHIPTYHHFLVLENHNNFGFRDLKSNLLLFLFGKFS